MPDWTWDELIEDVKGLPEPLRSRILAEFSDFQMVIRHCEVVYDYASGGQISKCNTDPRHVRSAMEEREMEHTREVWNEAILKAAEAACPGIGIPKIRHGSFNPCEKCEDCPPVRILSLRDRC